MSIQWLTGERSGTTEYYGAVIQVCTPPNTGDFATEYAIVWDAEENAPLEIEVRRIFHHPQDGNQEERYANVEVDASQQVWEAYTAYKTTWRLKSEAKEQEEKAQRIDKDKRVRVVRSTPRLPYETEGVVFWRGWDKFNADRERIGFKTDDGQKHFVYLNQVELVGGWVQYLPASYRPICQSCGRQARTIAELELVGGVCLLCRDAEFYDPDGPDL